MTTSVEKTTVEHWLLQGIVVVAVSPILSFSLQSRSSAECVMQPKTEHKQTWAGSASLSWPTSGPDVLSFELIKFQIQLYYPKSNNRSKQWVFFCCTCMCETKTWHFLFARLFPRLFSRLVFSPLHSLSWHWKTSHIPLGLWVGSLHPVNGWDLCSFYIFIFQVTN